MPQNDFEPLPKYIAEFQTVSFETPFIRYVVVKATNSKLLGTKILEIFDFFEYLT